MKCKNCECAHDGRTPGFERGECDCARIGGPWISMQAHEYEPDESFTEWDRCTIEDCDLHDDCRKARK